MITGKQRSELKKIAQDIKPAVMIGKEELTPSVIGAIDDYLAAHELVKVKKFILYRQAADPAKRKIIV